jgi:SDR family mycofactocin-dependent oxidoreductase
VSAAPPKPRVAVVTGAARGIGAATVAHLVGGGWRVLAVDAPAGAELPGVGQPLAAEGALDALAARWPDAVLAHRADVRDVVALRAGVARAEAQLGPVQAAVAAAAVVAGGRPLWEEDEATFRTLLDVDVLGVWNLVRAVMPALLDRPTPTGRIVALASAAATTGLWGLGCYGVAKHAVLGLVRGLGADLRGTGISAVAVAPGATRTAMLEATRDLYGLPDTARLSERQAIGRALEPEEVAAVVAFLCRPESVAVQGSLVAADGGFGL